MYKNACSVITENITVIIGTSLRNNTLHWWTRCYTTLITFRVCPAYLWCVCVPVRPSIRPCVQRGAPCRPVRLLWTLHREDALCVKTSGVTAAWASVDILTRRERPHWTPSSWTGKEGGAAQTLLFIPRFYHVQVFQRYFCVSESHLKCSENLRIMSINK